MKTRNKIQAFSALLLSFVMMTACERDGERIYLSPLDGNELTTTSNEVVLSQENAHQQVLAFSWTTQALTVSNPEMTAPSSILSTSLQASTQEDFSANVSESVESSLSRSYTGSELNTIAKNLGLEADVATAVYFRLKSSTGNNMEPVYSNILTVNITSYYIDMSVGFILDSNKTDTGITLFSPASDGVYTGFMGASSWYNFFMKEGDGTVWGNFQVEGYAFSLAVSTSLQWNCWFPGQNGCYYVTMDTNKKEWSALYMKELTVSGDISGTMTFDRPSVKWTYAFTATSTNPVKIKLSTLGDLYNSTTGDAASTSAPAAFDQQDGKIGFVQEAGEITVSVPSTGECTLTLDLSDPKEWKCSVEAGSGEPVVTTPQYLYVPGVDDIISGSWTFDNFLTLYNEDNLAYAGVFNVNSQWGYSLNIEKNNWTDKYVHATGDAYSGTLVFLNVGNSNIPAPAPGLYLIDVSLKGLTYNVTSVGNEIYVGGLNKGKDDSWDLDTVLPATATPGVYSGEVTINFASAWGFKIYLDTSWGLYFGGSNGKLSYQGNGITDDASLSIGTHQLTVDLIQGTYVIN